MLTNEHILKEMLEHDLVVCIPPKKSYDVLVKIESIEKGKPIIIIEPESITKDDIIKT